MKKYSLTNGGILIALLVPLIGYLGFTEACSSEITNFLLPIPGLVIAWIGRVRQGDVTLAGFKKD